MRSTFAIVCWALSACISQATPAGAPSTADMAVREHAEVSPGDAHHAAGDAASDSQALAAIRGVHGGAGPWVVAGYRMGRFALQKLRLPHGSFDMTVVHHSPREVQYSCIADGAAAATGASLGRLNLSIEPAAAAETRTTYRNQQSGASITLETTPDFAKRYADVPREQLSAAGEEVLHLPDAAIFREVATP